MSKALTFAVEAPNGETTITNASGPKEAAKRAAIELNLEVPDWLCGRTAHRPRWRVRFAGMGEGPTWLFA